MPPAITEKAVFKKLFGTDENILKTVSYMAFFIPSITDPIIYHLNVRKNDRFSADQKKTMIQQNWSHHSFNLTLEVVSLLVARPIIGHLFKGKAPSARVEFYKDVGGFLAMIFAKSFIRPFVMIRFAEKEKGKDKKPGAQTGLNTVSPSMTHNVLSLQGQPARQQPVPAFSGMPRIMAPIG